MQKSPFKPGDVVYWGARGSHGKYHGSCEPDGGWPDTVLVVKNEGHTAFTFETITISTLDGSYSDSGYSWNWFEGTDGKLLIDEFLTAVHKRRHP